VRIVAWTADIGDASDPTDAVSVPSDIVGACRNR
jgi:hypothetical protein